MIKLDVLRVFLHTSSSGLVDKIRGKYEVGNAFESRGQAVFYFRIRKFLTI